MKRKLQSRRGAALSFALLVFLVCAVIGAIVLSAGTAAAGRLSNLAESDERFYLTSSTAQLFSELFSPDSSNVPKVVVFACERSRERVTTTTVTGADRVVEHPSDDWPTSGVTYSHIKLNDMEGEDFALSTADLVQYLAYKVAFGEDDVIDSVDRYWAPSGSADTWPKSVSMTFSFTKDAKAYEIPIDAVISKDGAVTVNFKNEDVSNPFILKMTLIGDPETVVETKEVPIDESQPEKVYSATSYTETYTTTLTETRTITVTWKVEQLQVLRGGLQNNVP